MAGEKKTPQYDDATLIELGRTMLAVSQNPKTRKQVLKATKETFPTFAMPADLAAEEIEAKVDDKFATRDAEAASTAARARLESARAGLIDGSLIPGRKFAEDDVKKIEKLMETKGIADYESAAIVYGSTQTPADSVPPIETSGTWEMPRPEGLNLFNTTQVNERARKSAFAAIRELGAQRQHQ